MTQSEGPHHSIPPDKRPRKEAMALQPGDRIRLSDGSLREVVTNPLDGVWLIVKEIGADAADEEMALLTDIAGPA